MMATAPSELAEEAFTYKTRSEQRLEWLKTRKRPLTEAEADELYACLHAIYQRDWRRYRARQMEREAGRFVVDEMKRRNAEILEEMREEAAALQKQRASG